MIQLNLTEQEAEDLKQAVYFAMKEADKSEEPKLKAAADRMEILLETLRSYKP